jgi:hypothetical protein
MTARSFTSDAETIGDSRQASARDVFSRALDDCRGAIVEEIGRERWRFSLRIHVAYLSRLALVEGVPAERFLSLFKDMVRRVPEVVQQQEREPVAIVGYLARLALDAYNQARHEL